MNKRINVIFAVLLCGLIILALCACDGEAEDKDYVYASEQTDEVTEGSETESDAPESTSDTTKGTESDTKKPAPEGVGEIFNWND